MKDLSCTVVLVVLFNCLFGQMPVGSWTDHLKYNTAYNIAAGTDEIYASTGTSILVFNKKYNELKKMSPVNGLSETGVSAIGWSEENKILIIAYKSTNLDLIGKNTFFNIPDILNEYIPGIKKIYRVRTQGRYAYLATSFGIVVVDLLKAEIYDTWNPGPGPENNEVFDIAFGNNRIYAASKQGIWYADPANQGLAYYANWKKISNLPYPDSEYSLALFSGQTLYANYHDASTGDRIYAIADGISTIQDIPGVINTSFDLAPEGFTVSSSGSVKYYSQEGSLMKTISSYGWGVPNISQGIIVSGDVWIADIDYGLICYKDMTNFTILSLNGPASNSVVNINSARGKTIICGGGTDNSWNRLNRPFQASAYENYQFMNFVSLDVEDAMRSAIDPGNISHFFISSWGDGLFEYKNNSLFKHYEGTNSPLQNGNTSGSEIRICGLSMDKKGYLWLTQSDASGSIKILKPDGSWIVNPLTIDAPVIGDIIITASGQKWIVLPGDYGLFILDDNGTPDIFSDDRSRKLTVTDTDDNIIRSVFSAAEDLEGNIWIGTDQGPVIYIKTTQIFEDDVKGFRIKVPRNDGSGLADYMLGTESITSISVDGANRKWLGTINSGVYLLSPDGTKMLKSYNEKNSPVFSDSIAAVSVDNVTGEVWFGTSEGVLSVRETATSGKEEFQNVYSFPNPVREDYHGNVTITGLIKDTQIKITDLSGNLVYETISEGGQASWDLTTFNGRRVSTGVYLIFCANEEGSKSCVTKVLVVGN